VTGRQVFHYQRWREGLMTEKGICRAAEKDVKEMFSYKFN